MVIGYPSTVDNIVFYRTKKKTSMKTTYTIYAERKRDISHLCDADCSNTSYEQAIDCSLNAVPSLRDQYFDHWVLWDPCSVAITAPCLTLSALLERMKKIAWGPPSVLSALIWHADQWAAVPYQAVGKERLFDSLNILKRRAERRKAIYRWIILRIHWDTLQLQTERLAGSIGVIRVIVPDHFIFKISGYYIALIEL